MAQTPYPDLAIQDVAWNSGTHQYLATQKILSPSTPNLPTTITGTADAEFVSGTSVRLKPGFHAGSFSGNGRFHAHIDHTLGSPGDIVVIAPRPDSSIVDNVVQVPKWEKFEIGLRLPQAYEAAIDSFFQHFYSNASDPYTSTPGNVIPVHDLNPYADDSLQVVMTLTSPSGQQRMKWGFYMREARWSSTAAAATLTAAPPTHPHRLHNFHFRFAPDEEGDWTFVLSVKAPHTSTYANAGMPELNYTGHAFHCGPPLPEVHGYLHADTITRRLLRFDDGTAFFGLGVNMADWRRNHDNYWTFFRYRDFSEMRNSMGMLHEMGGNFMRMFLMDKIFTPQQVHLGVFDAYRVPTICSLSESADPNEPDCGRGWISGNTFGNAQYQAWAFDSLLSTAHQQQVYIQLCIDPYSFPSAGGEKGGWGANPFVMNFLDTLPRPYDVRGFFFTDGNSDSTSSGPFYYWKRKYKYIMSRWGYSVNLAIIEPFNEIDQMLTYCDAGQQADSLGNDQPFATCAQYHAIDFPHEDICRENRMTWPKNTQLPTTVSQWFTAISNYVREPVNVNDPVHSSLGETGRPFLASFAGAGGYTDQAFYLPFTNPKVDLLSVHQYLWPDTTQIGEADAGINYAFTRAQDFRNNYPVLNAPDSLRKPFAQGEHGYSTGIEFGNRKYEIEKFFHNYGVSFHNEIWSSAFSGKFATGMSWHWERVFWWTGALEPPPPDPLNNTQQATAFSSVLGATNNMDLGLGFPIPIQNRRLHHHFKPLADLLDHPSWTELGFFDSTYAAHTVFDASQENPNVIEAYYLKSTGNTMAIGWVHNRNAWVMNNFYLANTDTTQNFLGCHAPNDTSVTLTGFLPETPYHITWFPTWMNSTVHPVDTVWTTDNQGRLLLDLSTALFDDTLTNFFFMDTLRADYAFIITPGPFVKSMILSAEEEPLTDAAWDFELFPNPVRDVFHLRIPGDVPKDITILDVSGRQVQIVSKVSGPSLSFPVAHLAQGVYYVRVADGTNARTKKLIIH